MLHAEVASEREDRAGAAQREDGIVGCSGTAGDREVHGLHRPCLSTPRTRAGVADGDKHAAVGSFFFSFLFYSLLLFSHRKFCFPFFHRMKSIFLLFLYFFWIFPLVESYQRVQVVGLILMIFLLVFFLFFFHPISSSKFCGGQRS